MTRPEHEHFYGEQRCVDVQMMQVTAVSFARGAGCCEESTYRMVTAYYDAEGRLLWESDPAPTVWLPLRPVVRQEEAG